MNVHLTEEQQKFVQEGVSSGRYASASEVIRAGLRVLQEEEQWRTEVRRKIAEGVAQAKAGQLLDGNEVFEELLGKIERTRKSNP